MLLVKINNTFFKAQAKSEHKANVIFDVTLKSYPKWEHILMLAMLGGYKLENIHVVWVLNDMRTALKQNAARERKVNPEIIKGTHKGVAKFFKQVMTINNDYFNNIGDIYILFTNVEEADNDLKISDKGGHYLDYLNYVKIKKAGEKLRNYDDLMNMEVKKYDTETKKETGKETLKEKINRYIPAECDSF